METKYFVVANKGGEEVAEAVLAEIANGSIILSAVGTQTSVHYVIAADPTMLPASMPEMRLDEEAQIIKDNLDAEERARNAEPDTALAD